MDYFGIIKKAFKINLKNKFLWIFGILAGGAAGFNGFNYNSDSSTFKTFWSKFTNTDFSQFDLASFWDHHGAAVIAITIIFLILSIVFFVLNLMSQGALVGGIEKIETGEKTDFYKSFKLGYKKFWRIWALNITLLLAVLISLSLFVIPTCLLVISGAYVSAAVMGFLLFFVNLLFWIVVAFISPYALRIVVLRKLTVFQSIRQALHFVRDNLAEVIVTYLLLAAISFAVGLVAIIVLVIVLGLMGIIGFGIYFVSVPATILFGFLALFAILIVSIIFSGVYSSFHSSVLTLTYLKLVDRD